MFCRLVVGYPEIPKDTTVAPFLDEHHPNSPPVPGEVHWEIFFEVSLTKATERFFIYYLLFIFMCMYCV